MNSDFLTQPDSEMPEKAIVDHPRPPAKPPTAILAEPGETSKVFAFPPNRDTLGGTAYLIAEAGASILIDCPAWNDTNLEFCQTQGKVQWLVITHRGGIGKAKEIQQTLGCSILIQEQEAYLLPELSVMTFQDEFVLNAQTQVIWTAGHSPGSACVYYNGFGGVLFTGRHLLPDQQGLPIPLRTSKTFHWQRQLRNVQKLIDRFSPETLQFICPGGSTGFLRGKGTIEQAYTQLQKLDLTACATAKPIL
jgi:glyoxylase-like metal-dependent hydrolase (beta-lactamase superfamily II)